MSLPPGSQAALSHPSQRERVLKGECGGLRGDCGDNGGRGFVLWGKEAALSLEDAG